MVVAAYLIIIPLDNAVMLTAVIAFPLQILQVEFPQLATGAAHEVGSVSQLHAATVNGRTGAE